ncbi:MAG: cysteine desulfurase [Lachnospiraceae bacterium]|nr:cysteine desulfurase [Lachnospiraceae bacterium]
MREVYLDNSATTRVFPETAQLMNRIYLEEYGNPSSMHHKGVEAEKQLRQAKQTLAGILKVKPSNLYFTSCGTESDNIAIIGGALAAQRNGKHIITTPVEHPAVLESMKYLEQEGFEITYIPVDGCGRVDPEEVAAAVRPDTVLVSIMHTNNEIGALQPITEIGEKIKKKNPKVLFHVDAVQGFGKALIHPRQQHIDLLAASGHKIHAPKGVGLLYVADGVKLRNLIFGGGQQNGLRSGTENVAGAAGMALSAQKLYEKLDVELDTLYDMKQFFIEQVTQIDGVRVNGLPETGADGKALSLSEAVRMTAPHVISLSFENVRAEVLLHALEDKGIFVSAGSACASNRPHISATLQAIKLPENLLDSTIRFSTGVMNTMEDMQYTADALKEIVPFLRRYTRH